MSNPNDDPAPTWSDKDKFTLALGEVTWEWSSLHAALGDIFSHIVRPKDSAVTMAIWFGHRSDSGAREMMRKALKVSTQLSDDQKEETYWLLTEVEQIRTFRNNAMHVAWHPEVDIDFESLSWETIKAALKQAKIKPHPSQLGQAKRVAGQDVLSIFNDLSEYLHRLDWFARHLDIVLKHDRVSRQSPRNHEPLTLPQRPERPLSLRTDLTQNQGSQKRARRKNKGQQRQP